MSPGDPNTTLNSAEDCVKLCQAYEHDLRGCESGEGRLAGGGRGWSVDEGDAAPSITDKTNDAQTDGTRHSCHIQLVSSFNNLTLDQRMLISRYK